MEEITEDSLVPTSCHDENEMTVSQWGQREYESGYKTGYSSGVSCVCNHIIELAKIEFSNGKDEQAVFLRALAKKIAVEIKYNG